ncbi:MAG: hypothetical protein AAGM38_09575 [Pseudomonadota bacterium]
MKALLEIIDYLERRDRLDAAMKRQLAEQGVPLDVLYKPQGGDYAEALQQELEGFLEDEALEELDALQQRASSPRGPKGAGKGRGPAKPPQGKLADLAAVLAARRAAQESDLAVFGALGARLCEGAGEAEALRAALRAVIGAAPEPLCDAVVATLQAEGAAGLRALCAAALADYHLPLRRARRAAGDAAPFPSGPALGAYRMLIEALDPTAAGLVWVLREEEVALGLDLARAQRRLVGALRAALRAAPRRFAEPIKPFEPGHFGFLCGLLTAEIDANGALPAAAAIEPAGEAAVAAASRDGFARGLALGYGLERGDGATERAIETGAAAPEDHPLAHLSAYAQAVENHTWLPTAHGRERQPQSAWNREMQRNRHYGERLQAQRRVREAGERFGERLVALAPWRYTAPRPAL